MESLFYHYYSLFLIIFQYFIPVLIMTYSYVMVAFTIWRKRGNIDGQTSNSMRNNKRELNLLNGRKRVSFYLFTLYVFFCYSIINYCFNFPTFHYSSILLFQYFIIPVFHYSSIPLFQYSKTLILEYLSSEILCYK